ncbi:MAG: hypothetical protein RI885_2506 [Actinomycetota bacterium]
MYAALWRSLPGPIWVRVLIVVLVVVAVLTLCVYVVFPLVDAIIGTPEVTVEQ